MWLRPSAAASLRELQCVEPSAGLRGKVQLIMRASKRSVPGATALPGWRPQRPEIRPSRKRSRQSLTVSTLQDWLRLTPANVCPPVKPRIIRALRTSSARPPWLRLIPPNSRRSGGLNLKGAGMKKCLPHTSQMSLLHRTERPEVFCHRGCSRRRTGSGMAVSGYTSPGETLAYQK